MSRAFLTRRRLGVGRIGFKIGAMRGVKSRPMMVGRTRARTAFRISAMRTFPSLELKFHDVDLDDATVAAGANVTPSINLIAQGTDETERIGRKFTIKSINWRFQVSLPATTGAASTKDTIRVLMYLDKQANGATAAALDVLETADFQSFNNLSNKNRFRTLMDRTYDLNATTGGGDGTTEDYGSMSINDVLFKKVNIPIEYNATAATLTGITSNNIGVILMSSAGIGGFKSKIRLRFTNL